MTKCIEFDDFARMMISGDNERSPEPANDGILKRLSENRTFLAQATVEPTGFGFRLAIGNSSPRS